MNSKKEDVITFRDGNRDDNDGLIRLTTMSPMIGQISIRIDRKPDFFRLLEKRGKYHTVIAQKASEIIGSATISEMEVTINQKPQIAYYVSDFRIHPDYKKSTLAVRLAKIIQHKLISLNAQLSFCTIVDGNAAVMPFLSGRLLFPHVFGGSTFNVYQILPSYIEKKSKKYNVEEPENPDLEIFRKSLKRDFLFSTELNDDKYNQTRVLTASKNGKIVAAIALTDAEDYKQDILIDIPFILKVLKKGIQVINKIYPIINLPDINQSIKILYVRSFVCDEGFEDALKLLISKARKIAFDNKYHFLAVGVYSKSKFNLVFKTYPKFVFKTRLYFSSLTENPETVESIENGNLFWDFSV